MLTVIFVICGAVAAWIVVDHLIALWQQRRQLGKGGWSGQSSSGRVFHSTGFEDTLPPPSVELPVRVAQGLQAGKPTPKAPPGVSLPVLNVRVYTRPAVVRVMPQVSQPVAPVAANR